MQQSFSQTIGTRSSFYTFTGSAAATLLDLLFVALSLRLNIFRDQEVRDIRDLAIHTFGNFLYVVLIALVFLIPQQSAMGLGLPLVLLGVLGLMWFAYFVRQSLPLNQGQDPTRWFWRGYFAITFATYAGLTVAAWGVTREHAGSLYWLVAVVVALLGLACFSSLALLSHARSS